MHGHDTEAKVMVVRLLEQLGLRTAILHEQANDGQTIIEKLERHSDVGFSVVLLTPNDVGAARGDETNLKSRARQNVVLELGYFLAKLGRSRVCALHKEGLELPSDILGVLYTPIDAAARWQYDLARELKAAGIEVDMNRIS